jgi:2-hydroxychromene-2-carboxylate isomerase
MRVWLQRRIYRRITSARRRDAARHRAERLRQRRGEAHRVLYFHRPGDPVSALMAPLAAELARRFDIALELHLAGPPEAAAAPEPERLSAYARRDTAALAARLGANFRDPGREPETALTETARAVIAACDDEDARLQIAIACDTALWNRDAGAMAGHAADHGSAPPHVVDAQIRKGTALRDRLGHFQSGTLWYAGEWYWGADRLHYLESRLDALGARCGTAGHGFIAPPLAETGETGDCGGAVLEIYPSLRSPYTWLAMQRAFDLADRWRAQVDIRFVLPMVMRNLPVPRRKGLYFLRDAKREAERFGLPFGDICDPRGRPTERGLAVLDHAVDTDRGRAFLLSFLRGVWAEGIDAGSDRGLRRIAERAGLDWTETRDALERDAWRAVAEANRNRLFELGLWGVPSFRLGDFSCWGQDRLWQVEDALRQRAAGAGEP